MRIVFITPEFITQKKNFDGGLANYIYRVSLSLIELGHEPIIIFASDKDYKSNYNGIEVYSVKVENSWMRLLDELSGHKFGQPLLHIIQSWELNKKLKEIHKNKSIDIVQYSNSGAVGLFRVKKIPSVIRLSCYRPIWNQLHWQFNRNIWEERFVEWLEVLAFKRVDNVFGPSQVIAKCVNKHTKRPVSIIETPFILYETISDITVYSKKLEGKQYVLFMGRLNMLKGVHIIAEMIEDFFKKHPNLFFVFAGKDTPYKESTMMKYVINKAGKYRNHIIYLGRLSHEQLYPVISNSEIVILPSLMDNLPNACLEAMAHEKVVVGTNGTSFEQLIINGESGFLCKANNPKDLLETVTRALSLSENQKRQMERKASQRIKDLEPQKVVKELLNYYKQVIRKNKISK